jgi:hypothetical protein
MPPELVQWVPPGLFLLVSTLFALSILCEKYETVAHTFGRFGGWLRDRAAKGQAADYAHLQQEIKDLKGVVERQRGDLDNAARKITQLELVEEVNAVRRDMTTSYMQECAFWYVDAAMYAAQKKVRLPPLRTWTEFCAAYRAEHGIPLRKPHIGTSEYRPDQGNP